MQQSRAVTINRETGALAEEGRDVPLSHLVKHLRQDADNNLYARVMREVDRVVLTEVLQHTGGNQVRASAIMGIDRKTLRQKIRNLGLAFTRAHAIEEDHLAANR